MWTQIVGRSEVLRVSTILSLSVDRKGSVRDTQPKHSPTLISMILAQCNTPKSQVHFQGFSSFVGFDFNFVPSFFLSFCDYFLLTSAFREEPLFKLTSLLPGGGRQEAAASDC